MSKRILLNLRLPNLPRTVLCAVFVLVFVGGCNRPSPDANAETAADASAGNLEGDVSTEADASDPRSQQIVLWTPSFFDPLPGSPNAASDLLADALTQFKEEQLETEIVVQVKSEQGGSTIYDYLRSASKVAPSILPDIILVESQRLWVLADQDLILPFAARELAALANAYPFAQAAVTHKENVYGIPHTVNMLHTVQSRIALADEDTALIPKTWAELEAADLTYIFPAGARNGQSNDTILLHYVGAGGQLATENRAPNNAALVDVFNFVEQGVSAGRIPNNVIEYSDVDNMWLSSQTDLSGLVEISSNRYLAQRATLNDFMFGATPTKSGTQTTIGRVWAFAILTQDPGRRQVAIELIDHLLAPSLLGAWSLEANRLPAHRDALAVWNQDEPYFVFAQQQLESAVALPNGTAFVDFAGDVQQALLAVLSGEISAEEAVANIGD